MRIALVTREFPPEVYGGAGVHVEHLAHHLNAQPEVEVEVHCFGGPRPSPLVKGSYEPWSTIEDAALRAISVDLAMVEGVDGVDLVHSHTWYANLAGHLASLLHGIPHVMTAHSLEPLRPWKAEQLGPGYAVSSLCERTAIESAHAVIAVSAGMRADILECYPVVDPARVVVVHNGIDPDDYRPDPATDALSRHGIDPSAPIVVFVGRITHQKGIVHLLEAARAFVPGTQLVLCAASPDTPELGADVERRVAALAEERRVIWFRDMLPKSEIVQILSHARVLVCPSVYEPFGLVNLEAMACETAVVASAAGGIPEIVVDGETGVLVPLDDDPVVFAAGLGEAVNGLLDDAEIAQRMGEAGRRRVVEQFSWTAVARQTVEVYRRLA